MKHAIHLLTLALTFGAIACGATGGTTRSPTPVASRDESEKPGEVGTALFNSDDANYIISPKSARFAVVHVEDANFLVVKISDQPDDCGLLADQSRRKNSSSFILALYRLDTEGHTADPNAGPYNVQTGNGAFDGPGGHGTAEASRLDGGCGQALTETVASAVSGDVRIDQLSTSQVSGTFDLRMGSRHVPVRGTFRATFCQALAATATVSAVHKCL